MSSGSRPFVASTAAGGAASSSVKRVPAQKADINANQLVINTNIPQSSSPFTTGMGQSFGKSSAAAGSPPVPPPSPSVANRSISSAMAGGLRFTRALANRRKKSEDASKLMDRSMSEAEVPPLNHPQRIEATASISSSPPQLATNTLKKAAKMPQTVKRQPQLAPQPLSPPPPPVPPKPQQVSTPSNSAYRPKMPADPRSSIIPISPGIVSAVNYLRMEGSGLSHEPDPVTATIKQVPQAPVKVKEVEQGDRSEPLPGKTKNNMKDASETDKGAVANKDAWRNSDSTISHHTIRPGAQTSRPVSMAESLQSTHTVVPVKRQSALIDDADFGMPEEDLDSSDEESPSVSALQIDSPTSSLRTRERRAMSLTVDNAIVHKLPPTPSTTTATSFPFSSSHYQDHSSMQTTTNAQGFIGPSSSVGGQSAGSNIRTQLAVFASQPETQPYMQISAGSTSRHLMRSASPIPIQHPRDAPRNPYTRFPPPPEISSRLDRSLPALPPLPPQAQPRQPTLSMSGGFGLAKRAVEKIGLGRALWSGTPTSSSQPNQSSGYSSSSSGHTNPTNTAPSSYGAQSIDSSTVKYGHGMYEGLAAPRKSTSSNSGQSSHGSSGGYLHSKKNRTKHSAGSASISSIASHSTSASASDSESSGPNFGKQMRGPLRRGASGLVFGRDLRTVVKETAVRAEKPKGWAGRLRNWDSTTSLSGNEDYDGDSEKARNEKLRMRKDSVRKGKLKALEDRKLPALVVRCAQHLLTWGIQEEGLFRIPGRALHVTRLRTEFDSGADFDMTECSPGDLDPHAVASVFKAFLRELPEPILTSTLSRYFEAAMAQETKSNAKVAENTPHQPRNPSVGPGLPTGPRDATAVPPMRKAPSLSTLAMPAMTGLRPPSTQLINTFRTLLAQLPEENRDLIRTVTELIKAVALDSRETKMPLSNLLLVFCPSLNMSPPLLRTLCEAQEIWEAPQPEEEEDDEDDDDDVIVLDIRRQDNDEESYEEAQEETDEEESVGHVSEDPSSSMGYNASTEDMLDASLTLSTSSPAKTEHVRKPSVATSLNDASSYLSTSEDYSNHPGTHLHSVSRPSLTLSTESLNTSLTSDSHHGFQADSSYTEDKYRRTQLKNSPLIAASIPSGLSSTTPRPMISNPVLISSGPIQFPLLPENMPPSPQLGKRRSIPILSLPNLTLKSLSSPPPESPQSSSSSLASRPKRMKKPSLHLLFQKKSSPSLSSPKDSPSSLLRPAISSPYLQPRSASDSSVSTPLSAVTAPQASATTLPKLPPKIDTPIEPSTLRFGDGCALEGTEISAPPFSAPMRYEITGTDSHHPPPVIVRPESTPIADIYHRSASPSPSLVLEKVMTQRPVHAMPAVDHLRPNPTSRARGVSSSSTSSNHLKLLHEDAEQEDWTKSVLLAADVQSA